MERAHLLVEPTSRSACSPAMRSQPGAPQPRPLNDSVDNDSLSTILNRMYRCQRYNTFDSCPQQRGSE